MNNWCPIFCSIVDSSLWREPDFVVKIFITMLAKKDREHMVYGSAFNIGEWAKKTECEAIEALRILSSPDTKRIEPQEFDGRRIERRGSGWFILNGQVYQDMMVEMNERARKRRWAAEKRAQEKEEKRALKYADKHGAV